MKIFCLILNIIAFVMVFVGIFFTKGQLLMNIGLLLIVISSFFLIRKNQLDKSPHIKIHSFQHLLLTNQAHFPFFTLKTSNRIVNGLEENIIRKISNEDINPFSLSCSICIIVKLHGSGEFFLLTKN